jgi:hypothetical protein
VMTAAILRRLDMCSCVVTVAAAAQDTAEGAVVVAAGGAAGDPSEAASAIRISTGELRSDDSSDITTDRYVQLRGDSGNSSTEF